MSEKYTLEDSELIPFDFGDRRINKRANKIVNKMIKNGCEKTISQTFNTEADFKGACRFFNNNLVTPAKILNPHAEETRIRCDREDLIAVIQDSSDISFDYLKNVQGFESFQSKVKKGFRIHPLLVINKQGTPLGVIDAFNYTRSAKEKNAKGRNSLFIEEKESYRWLLGYRGARKLKKDLPHVTVVSISDREGDIYECFAEAIEDELSNQTHILVRSNHNRCLKEEDKTIDKLEKRLTKSQILYEAQAKLNQYKSNERVANLAIRATEVSFKAPATCLKKGLAPIKVNAVLVSEIDPPNQEESVYWLLLTTLPIDELKQIELIIDLYAKRWLIEIFFKVLKTGCKIDAVNLQEKSRIENFIALSMLTAWRVMLQTYLPREYPNEPCTILFTEIEWKLAYEVAYERKRKIPEKTPTLKEAVEFVAILGGYKLRKQSPGTQTIWRGTIRLMDLLEGYRIAERISLIR